MAIIRIVRNSEYNNKARKFMVWLDGQKLGEVGNGETKEFDVAAGQHSIILKLDWCSSEQLSFDLNPDESKSFYVKGFKYGNLITPIALGILVLHFVLRYAIGFEYLIFLVIPFALYTIYFLTFGRNRYLRLSDTFQP